ncbi:MAG: 2Fe-2S iron-sulfur cluster binding domain-containing protein, partial [Oscillospiraceae bacterium]|nr:2Fe-2S iron-sulfur cluster binding domain-containing protein [Oscillospiraceae bacterium]
MLELARRANVAIDAPCSGNGSCGKCRVKLVEGQVESIPSRHISDEKYNAGWRLSCCSKVVGDCTVFVPDIASAYQSRMKTADLSSPEEVAIFESCQKDLKASGIGFENNFKALSLTMSAPSEEDTMPDIERLTWAVQAETGAERVEVPYAAMVKLASTLREHGFAVCVKGEQKGDTFKCMEICGPEDTAIVGCAIDIGTTTVSMVLVDLTDGKILAKGSSGNGQIRYGADVINRIIEQGKPGGKKKLQDAIVKETLTPIIAGLCKTAKINAKSILRLCIGANTNMNHRLVGVDADPVRMDPYIPSFFGWEGLLAGDLKLPANPLAPVIIAPNI